MPIVRQDADTKIWELEGATCERLLAAPGDSADTFLVFYLQADGTWHRFFLDAGLLFWDEVDLPAPEDDLDEGADYVDLSRRLRLLQVPVKEICMMNATLTMRFADREPLVLCDSDGETRLVQGEDPSRRTTNVPSLLKGTVELTARRSLVVTWNLRFESEPPLTVERMSAALRDFSSLFPSMKWSSIKCKLDKGGVRVEIEEAGAESLCRIEQAHTGAEVRGSAAAWFSLRLAWPGQRGLIEPEVEPAGLLLIGGERGAVGVSLRLTVNLYTDIIEVYEKEDGDFVARKMGFAEAAAHNRELISKGLANLKRELGPRVESFETKVLEPGSIDETGILPHARIRVDNRKQLRKVGAFRELGLGHGSKSLRDAARAPGFPEKSEALDYLRAGRLVVFVPTVERDIFDESLSAGTPNLRTDGEFVWSELLPYYVENYDIALPEEFLAHARRNGWQVPEGIDTAALRI